MTFAANVLVLFDEGRTVGHIVDLQTGCWNWQGGTGAGYGRVMVRDSSRATGQRLTAAHVVIYERVHGPVPPGLELDHLCRNRACVNPDHLEPVSHIVNSQRGANARLTPTQVLEIRELRRVDGLSYAELGRRFAITEAQIRNIIARRCWRNVA